MWVKQSRRLLTGLVSGLAIGLIWLCYAAWAENNNLLWQKSHPNATLPATLFTKWMSKDSTIILAIVQIVLLVPWGKPFHRAARERIITGKRVSSMLLLAYGLLSLCGIGLGTYLGTGLIDYFLWDNQDALQIQRQSAHQEWQAQNKNPFVGGLLPEPNTKGFPRAGLGCFLILAFAGVWTSANLLRHVLNEHSFVPFSSSEEEKEARRYALWLKEQEAMEGARRSGRPRTLLRFSAGLFWIGLGLLATGAIIRVSRGDAMDYWALPTGLVAAWGLSFGIILGRTPQSKGWFSARLLIVILALASMIYLLQHHERAVVGIGLVLGAIAGLVHGFEVKRVLTRCSRFTAKRSVLASA